MKAYLNFYEKHNVIPVNQALTREHALRRTHLYREMGCTASAFKNSKVLEVGPGTGDNAVITSNFGPREFWLVDGNSASCTELNKKIESGLIKNAILKKMDIMGPEFEKLEESFDIIICEGASAQEEPKEFYKRILKKANKTDALVIFSCSSTLSTGSELLRMFWNAPLAKLTYENAIEKGAKVFAEHLKTLKGVSRTSRDWVIDSILNPKPKGFSFDIVDLLELATEMDFIFLGSSSPRFFQDYTWYKQFDYNQLLKYNEKVKYSWQQQMLCTLDTRLTSTDVAEINDKRGEVLEQVINAFSDLAVLITDMYSHPGSSVDTSEALSIVKNIIKSLDHEPLRTTQQSVIDLEKALPEILAGEINADTGSFKEFWGRGQQYVSLTRSNMHT